MWTYNYSLYSSDKRQRVMKAGRAGTWTIEAKINDGLVDSNVVTTTVTVTEPSWSRTISSGSVIASTNVSHQADIAELLTKLNRKRVYFGLPELSITGNGQWAKWRTIMNALGAGVVELYAQYDGLTVEWDADATPNYPSAAIINELRRLIEGL